MSTRTIVLFILVFKKEIGQNEPKETWQFSKFAHNSAEGVIYMKQGFDPPKLGVVCDKKLSPFFDSGVRRPFFCNPNHGKWPFLGAKKRVFGRLNKKTETTLCRQLYPKMVDETLVSLIFGRFPLIKSQNQNPMLLSVSFCDKNLIDLS